jgi:hypothetical protein
MFQAVIINHVIPVVIQIVPPAYFLVTTTIYLHASEWQKTFRRQIMKEHNSSSVWPRPGLESPSLLIDCRSPCVCNTQRPKISCRKQNRPADGTIQFSSSCNRHRGPCVIKEIYRESSYELPLLMQLRNHF